MEYLHFLFSLGKSYAVINCHKAMLLQTLPFFGNVWCNDTKLITRFMKGVFMRKPHKARYQVTWNVQSVLTYLSSLYPLSSLSLKLLTFKVVALIALAAAPRAQMLTAMHLDYMVKEDNAVLFTFPNLLKTSRIGHSYTLRVEHYAKEELCAMHTLLYYIKATRSCRLDDHVLVSYITHRAVTSSTVARWLRCVLELSGIDTSKFKAHSFRGASVSAAFSKGCSLSNILKTADWSTDKHFRKYYYRHAVQNDKLLFVNAVFD